jgi:UPF0755 protein
MEAVDGAEDGFRFEVEDGDTALAAGGRLFRAGFIRSFMFWRLICKLNPDYIRKGVYALDASSSSLEILDTLQHGEPITVRVTIPEGATLSKIASILERLDVCPAAEFLEYASSGEPLSEFGVRGKTLEGFLFPDTYSFPLRYGAKKAADSMARLFYEKFNALTGDRKLTKGEINDAVTLASIIEREYRDSAEAPVMAGVFYNRLAIGMALQSCATVEYVITEIEGRPHPERLLYSDLDIVNPYNTYRARGLPPGPISCPGAVAIDAALNPQKNAYLYFVLVDPSDGRHHFSRGYGEHLANNPLYVKAR